jgi:hypothetical protein
MYQDATLPYPTDAAETARADRRRGCAQEAAGLLGISVESTAKADVGTEHRRSDLRHAPAI